jgi:hypothetical protein
VRTLRNTVRKNAAIWGWPVFPKFVVAFRWPGCPQGVGFAGERPVTGEDCRVRSTIGTGHGGLASRPSTANIGNLALRSCMIRGHGRLQTVVAR